MRLSVSHIANIAILSEATWTEILPAFRCLKRLTKGRFVALDILNLLRCCLMLSALRINLIMENKDDASNKQGVPDIPRKEIQIAALFGLRHHFLCLQSSLKRVVLQFLLDKLDYLGVKLINRT
jgi:hypothetical protein